MRTGCANLLIVSLTKCHIGKLLSTILTFFSELLALIEGYRGS